MLLLEQKNGVLAKTIQYPFSSSYPASKKTMWNTFFAKYLHETSCESFGSICNQRRKYVIFTLSNKVKKTIVDHLQSNQEKTDIEMLHDQDVISNGANKLYIHSPDTDVLVLSKRHCLELGGKAAFVNGTGQIHQRSPSM